MLAKWHQIYTDTDELHLFVGKDKRSGLVRSQYDWRSVSSLAKEAGLSVDRTEQLIKKFVKMGVVVHSAKNESHYGYWEKVSPNVNTKTTLVGGDQASRIKAKKP